MPDLNVALRSYIKQTQEKSSLKGFINQGADIEGLVVTWFEIYESFKDAKSQLRRKFSRLFYEVNKKKYKDVDDMDLEYLYNQSIVKKAAMNNGTPTSAVDNNNSPCTLRIRLKLNNIPETSSAASSSASASTTASSLTPASTSTPTPTATTSSTPTPTAVGSSTPVPTTTDSSTSVSSSTIAGLPASSDDSSVISPTSPIMTSAGENTIETMYKAYINRCKIKSKQYGLNLQSEIHQVLACKNIILLKNHQLDKELLGGVEVEEHAKKIKNSIMLNNIKVDDFIFTSISAIFRGVKEEANRRNLKIKLNKLYEMASEEDGKIVEVFINLTTKLPNFERIESIGELELITNFLEPIFSPLFHDPQSNKNFIWLNRQEEKSKKLRPDGIMINIPERAASITLGYCEVKPSDISSNLELAFIDLVRLATLSRDLAQRKENKKALTIQAIGYNAVVYFIEETFSGITTMTEISSFTIPKTICEVSHFVAEIDNLKKIATVFNNQCQLRYKYPRSLADDDGDDGDDIAINPKRRKSRTPSFSLV